MTDKDILVWAKSIHYAHVAISPDFYLHYGKGTWEKRVPELSEEQRTMLMKHIEGWRSALAQPE